MRIQTRRHNKHLARDPKTTRGQSMLEFALVLPILLTLFLATIELALTLRAQLVLTNANREAARYASYGAFTDDQIAQRAVVSFAEQLPVTLSGPEANTGIIVTRFHIPAGDAEATYDAPYITGTLTYTDSLGILHETVSKFEPDVYKEEMKTQNAGFFTSNDIVVVETYYHHHQVLNAPIVGEVFKWVFSEPIVLYSHTVMRISRPRVEE